MQTNHRRTIQSLAATAAWLGSLCAAVAAPLSFFTDQVEYRLGESVMIPVRTGSAVVEATDWEIRADKPGRIEILQKPQVLEGRDTGFARIRTLAPGSVVLHVGGSQMRVNVSEERPTALLRKMRPRFTSPAEGAYAWGEIAIGAEIWVGAPGVDRMKPPEAALHLPDGNKITPDETFPPIDGPFWRLVFTLDTTRLEPGDHELTISCKPPVDGGADIGGLTSDPHPITILAAPSGGDIIFTGECEEMLETPRSERMGSDPPGMIMDAAASSYRAVALRRSRPVWVIQPEIKEPGRYQWIIRARGALAASVYPSLGIVRGENVEDAGSGRLVSSAWHNIPVGRPIRLETGPQWVGLTLANEFNYRNQTTRTAEIDRFELRRVPDAADSGAAMMMMAGDPMMMQGGGDNAPKDKDAPPSARGLKAAFSTLADGGEINGRMEIRVALASPALRDDRDYAAIRTYLWINGERHDTASGRHPKFTVHPHDLKKGTNQIEAHAVSPCGAHAAAPSITLLANSPAHPAKPLARGYDEDRQDLNRRGWDRITKTTLKDDHPLAEPGGPTVVHHFPAGSRSVRFALSDSLTGERRISIHARSIPGQENGTLSINLRQPRARNTAHREIELGRITPGDTWEWHAISAVHLESGPKTISIRPVDGEAALAGLSIDTPKFLDAAPPVLDVLYPKPNARLSADGDALVVRAFDDLKPSHFEITIDGTKTPLDFPATQDTGPILLPLPASWLPAGSRTLEITAVDHAGKRTTAPAIRVEVGQPSGSQLTHAYPRALRLASVLGYGPDPHTLARILIHGEDAWLDEQLNTPWGDRHDQLVEALGETWFSSISDYNIRGRVITDLLATRRPARARFSQFVQNHFSTWISKTGSAAKWEEHRAFRDTGAARFQDLLLVSATSPAMMVYLDQQNSLGRQLNENYAREVMELHTVGVHGGYKQEDVTNLAHLLTGWGAQREAPMDGGRVDFQYRFSPYLNESTPREIFGLAVPAAQSPETADDRIRMIVEMLAARPQTARFLAEKTVAHYLGTPADPATVDTLAHAFLQSGGDMAAVLRALVASPRFMAVDAPGKLMNPIEFGVVRQRATGSIHPWSVINLGDRSGRNLFDRASPDGYPEDDSEYADSNYQLQKWNFCKEMENALATGLSYSWFDIEALQNQTHRDAVIDIAFAARVGRAPSASTRDALHAILQQDLPDTNKRRSLFASVLHMMPEFQTR